MEKQSKRLSVRLPAEQNQKLQEVMQKTSMNQSRLIRTLLEEALRMRECPGIVFEDTPVGREAALAGTGLLVWEVITLLRSYDNTDQLIEDYPNLQARNIRNARAYYNNYTEEIDQRIKDNQDQTKSSAKEQYPHLFQTA